MVASSAWAIVQLVVWQNDRAERLLAAEQERSVVELQHETLEQAFNGVYSDLLFLCNQSLTIDAVRDESDAVEHLTAQLLTFMESKPVYDQIRLLDLQGNETIRINFVNQKPVMVPESQLQFKGDRYYVERARDLTAGQVYVSQFDLNLEQGKLQVPLTPVIRFITPVTSPDGTVQGWIVLNVLGRKILDQFSAIAKGFSGDCYLVNAAGEFLFSPKENQAWGWMLGHDNSFARLFERAWQQFPQSEAGQLQSDGKLIAYQRLFPEWARRDQGWPVQHDGSIYVVSALSDQWISAQSQQLRNQLTIYWLMALPLIALASFFYSRLHESRRQQSRELARSGRQLRSLSNQLMSAQEIERKKIARDLHDDFGQQITALIIDLESQRKKLPGKETKSALDRPISDARNLLRIMHQIVQNLRPLEIDDLSICQALETLIEEFKNRHSLEITFSCQAAGVTDLSSTIKENLFRIVQESLSNIVRHAQCNTATVELKCDLGVLTMAITDTGTGFIYRNSDGGFGLVGMRERAELLGGRLVVESSPNNGTAIRLTIPLESNIAGEYQS